MDDTSSNLIGWATLKRATISWLVALLALAVPLVPGAYGEAMAQSNLRVVKLSPDSRTSQVLVPLGKSENIRTSNGFNDVIVGDPEIADVMPLTDRTLSVLGRKVGLTRISVYGEGKQLVGVFDVEVSHDTNAIAGAIRSQYPDAKVRVTTVNGRIMLSGVVPDAVTLDKALQFAKQFSPDVINSMSVAAPQQVLLEVRFVEASRNAGRELGVQWEAVGNNIVAAAGTAGVLSGTAPFGAVLGRLVDRGVKVDAMISALEQRGVARRLAEPNLVALSGDTASFLAGGEFPFPVASQFNQITIQFKKFGVGLAFTPTVLSKGLINLKIEPEVSQLDPTNVVQVGNISVPSLIVRRASTTIELRDGQSFAIAGLLQSTSSTAADQLPWIADVPVLGSLFRSASFQKRETDLVIIVTPRLVRAARPGDLLRTPLDATTPPNDNDLFLHGKHEVSASDIRRIYGAAAAAPTATNLIARSSPRMLVKKKTKAIVTLSTLSLVISACSDIYFDRRDSIHLSVGDSNASNIAVQTIDPWPPHAANRNILVSGEKIQPAIQRYKEGKVTPPRGMGTSSIEISTSPGSGENK